VFPNFISPALAVKSSRHDIYIPAFETLLEHKFFFLIISPLVTELIRCNIRFNDHVPCDVHKTGSRLRSVT
jgi:hypothetical protein